MTLDLTDEERALLLELVEAKLPALLHEIHHTDARDFKESLKREYDLAEGLKAKIEGLRRYES
jgi:hypothetical protein